MYRFASHSARTGATHGRIRMMHTACKSIKKGGFSTVQGITTENEWENMIVTHCNDF